MRNKVNLQSLKAAQNYASHLNHPIFPHIYSHYYPFIHKFYADIRKKFKHTCIHGNYPHLALPFLLSPSSNPPPNIFSVSSIPIPSQHKSTLQQATLDILEEEDKFDLIISCMEMHKFPKYESLLEKYKKSLKPDGVLIGCCFGQNTLSTLCKAYLLAENERCGGISPKVLNFPSIGMLGNSLTTIKYELPTILTNDIEIQFESVTDLMTLLQLVGESGIVRGRRKGVFKDLLLSMSAIYDTQNKESEEEKGDVLCRQRIEIISFIGWKYHEDQPKALKRRPQLAGQNFVDELKKHDPELVEYALNEKDNEFRKKEE